MEKRQRFTAEFKREAVKRKSCQGQLTVLLVQQSESLSDANDEKNRSGPGLFGFFFSRMPRTVVGDATFKMIDAKGGCT